MTEIKTMNFLIALATIFSVGHHVDHLMRANHVGWPVIGEVTPFTISLGFYPIIALGYYFYISERLSIAFWSILAAVGLGFVGLTHLGPRALEPPRDILLAYSSRLAGTIAFIWLVAFLLILLLTSLYAARQWLNNRY